MNVQLRQRLLASTLVMGSLAIASPGLAQGTEPAPVAEEPVQEQAPADSDEIVVTGSRVQRSDLTASVPVAVVTDEAIQATGAGNLQDVLNELPVMGTAFGRQSSNFSTSSNGAASVNLRNLGSNRTLVLVDGRRFVTGFPTSQVVDINTIPTDLIERVEVVTGGASAVYGSEAISGVVNFVLKDKYEGFGVKAQATISDQGDAARQYISATAGTSFNDGRGNVILYGQYDNDRGLESTQRSFSRHDFPNRSSFAAQGLFSLDLGSFAPGPSTLTFNAQNQLVNYAGANTHGYDRAQDRYLTVPVERYLGTLVGNYELSDSIEAFVEGEYALTKSNSSLEPLAVANTDLDDTTTPLPNDYAIPITNPFIPAAMQAQIAALNADADPDNDVPYIPFRRRSNDIFDRSNDAKRDLWRVVAGLRGEIGEGFKWETYYTHGKMTDETSSGTILGPNYVNALNAVAGPNGPVCSINVDADPSNNDPACVPINIFGFNTVSPEAAAYVTNNGQRTTLNAEAKQDVFSAVVSGSIFDLPGGPLGVAGGFEYRKEAADFDYDEATNLGLTLGNLLPDVRGKYNVKEVFVEAVAPILTERPGFHYLGVEGAVRYSDYSTVGGVWSWKAGGEYAPIRDIRFRGVYSVATRAPIFAELFSPAGEDFPSVTDPCDQRAGGGDNAPIEIPTASLPAGCLAIPAIAAAANTPGGFVYSTAQIQTINGFAGGNPNLNEEQAKTLTLGVVFTPAFLRNFSLTVDYYRIKVADAIGTLGFQTSLDECFTGTGLALFCDNIIRNASGHVVTVNDVNLNTGSALAKGIDTQARYKFNVGSAGVDLSVFWTHLLAQEQISFPGGPLQDELGQLDCYNCGGRLGSGFKNKVASSATFTLANWSLNWRSNYYSSAVDDLTDANPIKVPSFWYHNAQVRVGVGEDQKFEFYFGANNLFDKKPPLFNDTDLPAFPGTRTLANTYDTFGRMLYAGMSARF